MARPRKLLTASECNEWLASLPRVPQATDEPKKKEIIEGEHDGAIYILEQMGEIGRAHV